MWTVTSRMWRTRSDPVQLERLVEEAIATFMPDLAEERRLARADGRYFTVEQQQISYDGTAAVHGELDLADARDLEQAISWPRRPAQRAGFGGLPERAPRRRRR